MAKFSQVVPTTVTGVINLGATLGPKAYSGVTGNIAISGERAPTTITTETVAGGTSASFSTLLGLVTVSASGTGGKQSHHGGGVPRSAKGRGVYDVIAPLADAYGITVDPEPWESWATTFADHFTFCADKTGKSPGQDLFVQWNLFSILTGGGRVDSPTGPLYPGGDIVYEALWNIGASGSPDEIITNVQANGNDVWACLQNGQGLANPMILLPAGDPQTNLPGSVLYEKFKPIFLQRMGLAYGLRYSGDQPAAMFFPGGEPVLTSSIALVINSDWGP